MDSSSATNVAWSIARLAAAAIALVLAFCWGKKHWLLYLLMLVVVGALWTLPRSKPSVLPYFDQLWHAAPALPADSNSTTTQELLRDRVSTGSGLVAAIDTRTAILLSLFALLLAIGAGSRKGLARIGPRAAKALLLGVAFSIVALVLSLAVHPRLATKPLTTSLLWEFGEQSVAILWKVALTNVAYVFFLLSCAYVGGLLWRGEIHPD